MIHPQDPHVRAPPCTALLDHLRRRIVEPHKRHRPGCHAHRGAHDIVLGSQPREPEPRPATRLVDERHVAQRVVDAAFTVREGVVHGQHEARRELSQWTPGIHQRRAVGHPDAPSHQVEESLGQSLHRPRTGTIARVGLGDGAGDAPEQVPRLLGGLPLLVLDQVAPLQNGDGVGAQIERVSVVRMLSDAHDAPDQNGG